MQTVVRAGLWIALAIGCLGGTVALLRPSGGQAEVVRDPSAGAAMVPAPVAGVAELTVERWLTASGDERQELGDLFAEPVPTGDDRSDGDESGGLDVRRVTTVGGERLEDGYWSVTLAVELVGTPPSGAGDDGATDDGVGDVGADEEATDGVTDGEVGEVGDDDVGADEGATGGAADGGVGEVRAGGQATGQAGRSTTWFLQVGIVGDGDDGYVALSTPAVLPARTVGDPQWGVSGSPATPEADDPLADMVERFLSALLAGTGDPAPYLAPGAEIATGDAAVFSELSVTELATEDLGDGQVWVSVQVLATTPDEVQLPLTYDLVLVERTDRWEVLELSGVPTLIE